MEVAISEATPADIEAVAAIERACFSDPWSPASFREILMLGRAFFACARQSDTPAIAGYVVASFAADEGEIANLAVDPSARRSGIGGLLLDTVLDEARQRGTMTLYLEVRDSNLGARALYASRGFAEVGRRRRYYRFPDEDAIILSVGPAAMKRADAR